MGYTRRPRFLALLALGVVGTGAMGAAVAQGGISAHMALSNTIFTLQVGDLRGDQFGLYTAGDEMHNGTEAVSRMRIGDAHVSDVCVSAPVTIPGLGERRFQMLVPGDNFSATNLVIGAKSLAGQLTLERPQIGVDAHQFDPDAAPGQWGLVADSLSADGQKIETTSLSADRLTAAGSRINLVTPDDAAC